MTIQLPESSNTTEVQARPGDTLEIRLHENATTGYRWALDHLNAELFAEVSSDADYPPSATGSGGTAILRVKTIAQGSGTLNLKYWRSFEGDSGVIQRFAVKVHISNSQ